MKGKHKKRSAKRHHLGPVRQPGELSKPAEPLRQALLFFMAFGQTILTWVLIIVTGVLQIRFFWIPMEDLPLQVHAFYAMACVLFLILYLKSPVSRMPSYHDLPIERVDFRYVFRVQWRLFFFVAALATLNLIPAFYFLGTYNKLATLALDLGSNPWWAKVFGGFGTAVLAGIVANFVTYTLLGIPRWLAARYYRSSGSGDKKR